MDNDWAYNEIAAVPLWDQRCRPSLARACQRLAEHAQLSFSNALGSLRKSVSRILHHQETTPQDLLYGHVVATARRCRQANFVLVASDTTFMNFTRPKALPELGPISDKDNARGFLTQSALALTQDGVPLGLLCQNSWTRDPAQKGQAQERHERAIEDKESSKWLKALNDVQEALPVETRALLLQDREADIFEFFAAPRRPGIDLLVRVAQSHRLAIDSNNTRSSVRAAVLQAPVEGTKTVTIPAKSGQKERQAVLRLRRTLVTVPAPRNGKSQSPGLLLWVVAAVEETPPAGVQEPVEWILLTTLPVPDVQTACLLVDYYARRWLIERFHYVLKSGCGFERLQVDTVSGLMKALSLFSIVAWRLLHLLYLARQVPSTPAEEVISWEEREILEKLQGCPVSTVAEVVRRVAQLGGFRGVPSAPTPGVKSLWLGWRKLADIVIGYQLARGRPSP